MMNVITLSVPYMADIGGPKVSRRAGGLPKGALQGGLWSCVIFVFVMGAMAESLFEDFDSYPSQNSLNIRTNTIATGEWIMSGVTQMGEDDHYIGKRGVRLRGLSGASNDGDKPITGVAGGGNFLQMNFDKAGVGNVSFQLISYGNHSNGVVEVQYSTDQGISWIDPPGNVVTAQVWSTAALIPRVSVPINVSDNVRVRLLKRAVPGNHSVNIDDLLITDYSEGNKIPVLVELESDEVRGLIGERSEVDILSTEEAVGPVSVTVHQAMGVNGVTNLVGNATGASFSWTPAGSGSGKIEFHAADAAGNHSFTSLTFSAELSVPVIISAKTVSDQAVVVRWQPVQGAVSYTVSAVRRSALAAPILHEDFTNCIVVPGNASDNVWGRVGNMAISDFASVGLTNWSGLQVYCAASTNNPSGMTDNLVKVGIGDSSGLGRSWLMTPPLDLSAGSFTLSFSAVSWGSDDPSVSVQRISAAGVTNLLQLVTLSKNGYQTYSVPVGVGAADDRICFVTRNLRRNRFFLDDVALTPDVSGTTLASEFITVSMENRTARISPLQRATDYSCTVTAVDSLGHATVSTPVLFRLRPSSLFFVQ